MIPIKYLVGDATRPAVSGPKIIAHICNDVGGWGRGFVVALSRRWAAPEAAYRAWFRGMLHPEGPSHIINTTRYAKIITPNMPLELGLNQIVTPLSPKDVDGDPIDNDDISVINMIAQRGVWQPPNGRVVDYNALERCLEQVGARAEVTDASVHMPRIGCGMGGGRWDEVEPIIVRTLCARDVPVYVYDLSGAP